jgi:hypothetical protein
MARNSTDLLSQKNVALIGRANRKFWRMPWRHTDSDKTYDFLTHPARVKKGMAVWDNGLPTTHRRKSKMGGFTVCP